MTPRRSLLPLLLAAFLALSAGAQAYPPRADLDEILDAIATARSEILIATTSLQIKPVAEALHQAYTRGVHVVIVALPVGYVDPDSYLGSLALLGLDTYITEVNLRGHNLVIDGRVAYVGPAWALLPSLANRPTYRYDDPAEVRRRARAIRSLTRNAATTRLTPEGAVALLGER